MSVIPQRYAVTVSLNRQVHITHNTDIENPCLKEKVAGSILAKWGQVFLFLFFLFFNVFFCFVFILEKKKKNELSPF